MQTVNDIFAIFGGLRPMAAAIGARWDTVRKWDKFGRIPEDSWQAVMDAALLRGHPLTAVDLFQANKTPKQRGRRAHKVRALRRKRRSEPRVSS